MKTLLKLNSWIIILILLVAAFFRLYRIADYMTFLGDEGRDAIIVLNILHGKLTLLGPTASVGGFFMGPIYYYFMAPFLWLFQYNPVGPSVMVALFGVATVWLIYKIGAEFFDKTTGITASILYSIAPLIIAYSRASWNPNLVPFFSLLTLYVLYKALNKNKKLFFVLCGFLYGILIQLHYTALFSGAIIILYVIYTQLLYANKRPFIFAGLEIVQKGVFILIGFLIGFSPFLAFELRHNFANFKSIIHFIFSSGETGANVHFLSNIWDVFFRVFGRAVGNFPSFEQFSQYSQNEITLWQLGVIVMAGFSIAILFFQILQARQKKRNATLEKTSLLLIWLIVGVLCFGFYKKSIYDYYFEFMFPLPFLLVGNTLSFLYKKSSPFRAFSIIVFLILVILNLKGIPFRYPPNKQLAQTELISRFVLDKTDGKSFNFALITGANSDHAYRYFFILWNHPPIAIENPFADPRRTSVSDQLLIVCEVRCLPLGHPLWEVAGFGRAEIAGEWNISVVKVYKLIHYKIK